MAMNFVTFARFYISYLLFNVGGWVYFGYLLYYASFLKADTCNGYMKELMDVAKIFLGLAMASTSLNIMGMTMDALNHTETDIENGTSLSMDHLYCMFTATFLFLSVSGIFAMSVFGLTSGMSNIQCSDANAEFALKLLVYGLSWIAFVEMAVVVGVILSFLYDIITYAKVCEPCFDIYKRYRERRIVCGGGGRGGGRVDTVAAVAAADSEPTMKKYNSCHVTIPMPVATEYTEEPKIMCSICYDASITLLLEPCNHICMCGVCYDALVKKECPICKTAISATKKVYFATPGG